MSGLNQISAAVQAASQKRIDDQKEHSAMLEAQGALEFSPDSDPEMAARGIGVGWFQIGNDLFAYRRWANGYELLPMFRADVEFIKKLAEKLIHG